MEKHLPDEDSAHVLALAIALWGAAVTLAAGEGVFARLPEATLAALAIFALLYAPATVLLDRGIRELLGRIDVRIALATLAVLAALLVGLAMSAEGSLLARLGQESGSVAALFVAPVAAALAIALMARPAAARSAPVKSPGATPAAT